MISTQYTSFTSPYIPSCHRKNQFMHYLAPAAVCEGPDLMASCEGCRWGGRVEGRLRPDTHGLAWLARITTYSCTSYYSLRNFAGALTSVHGQGTNNNMVKVSIYCKCSWINKSIWPRHEHYVPLVDVFDRDANRNSMIFFGRMISSNEEKKKVNVILIINIYQYES